MEKSIKYIGYNFQVTTKKNIVYIEGYCIQNDDLNNVLVMSICRKSVLTADMNVQAKSNKKLEFDYIHFI